MSDSDSEEALVELHGDQWWFWCPGCNTHHAANSGWSFNGNTKKPTFSPSFLSRGRNETGDTRCHLFVRNGKLQYLSDCTHKYAGQTIDMEPMEN